MTKAELIALLASYPSDMQIIVLDGGDGGGYNRVTDVEVKNVSLWESGRGSYYGELDDYVERNVTVKSHDGKLFYTEHFPAILIS